ncbi:MAG: polyprenyl synthetase family protein [Bacteroidetes bacterium]|uniref:Polyprenyl synthetase family protein n=1 Tax=Candidatus Cryptobacteroides intestinigallinarum TaxID=2840767 RepID=A0A9D9HJJ7_9BACT|nr:polyprenyl synthetase family protein [Candidatus Cryptobacteroides intestinigallinarum]
MINETQIEDSLKELFGSIGFASEPQGLYDPLRYMIDIGGKRIRPRLCLLAYSLFKDSFSEEILQPAAAIEVFHSFTLIHDDIMDKADMRRGKPTVASRWDGNTAILSGDVMCIDSYRRLAKAPADKLPQLLELFTTTAAQVCEGQQYDMDFEKLEEVSMPLYMKMIGLKTAVLIACSAKMGAVIAGADARTCDYLYKFGYNLGLAFQITDDYLDTFGDQSVFGKKIGGDIVNNKKTWLLTRALEKSGEMEKSGVIDPQNGKKALLQAMGMSVSNDAEKDAKIKRVKDIYEAIGIDEDAKYEIIKLHADAMENAGMTGLGKVRYEMLHRFADRLLGRNK